MEAKHRWVRVPWSTAGGKASSVGDGGAGVALERCDVLVEQRFCWVWSRWPLIVAMDCGGCCCKDWRVRPANLGTCPHRRASSSMERHGLKRAACAKVTRLAGEATNGGVGMMSGRWAYVKFPQFGFWSMVALQEDSIVMTDGDSGSSEHNMGTQHHIIAQWIRVVGWLSWGQCGHCMLWREGQGG